MQTEVTPVPSRGADLLIAALLFCASLWVIVATNDMGFVRDEAFYFGHAETYQDWFLQVEEGGQAREKALQHKQILDTWHNNAEHPPLDKILFGYSWRLLGRKLRPIQDMRLAGTDRKLDVVGLGPAHGFAVGAPVAILSPQVVGEPSSPAGRTLVRGEVVERKPDRAVVRLAINVDLAKLTAQCPGPGPAATGEAIYRTGCEAVELRTTYILSESNAMRLPGAAFGALLVALIYLAGRFLFGGRLTAAGPGSLRRPFALLAAVGYLCIPQPFWHAHLSTFDTTIAALLFLTTVTWHRALVSRPWMVVAGLSWGLALLSKHNALFLPVPLILHWLWTVVREHRFALTVSGTARQWLISGILAVVLGGLGIWVHPLVGVAVAVIVLANRRVVLELPPVPAVFVVMLALGPAVLVLGWPLLWVDSLDNLLRWIEFHLHHEHYMQYYFGQVLQYPPFPGLYAWVMTALTWPVTLLAAFLVGMVASYGPHLWTKRPQAPEVERREGWLYAEQVGSDGRTIEQRSWDRLVLLSALWPIALFSLPGTPIFGGTKHWMPAFPYMLLIGARGAQAVWRQVTLTWQGAESRPNLQAIAASWVLAVLLLAPAARATADTRNHGSAYFNELIGGLPGAAEAGMQRQFWGGSTRDGLDFVNRHAPANAAIWFHKSAWGAYQMYQREGWFRRDLRYAGGPEGTAMGIFHHQKDHDDFELDLMRDYGTRIPEFQSQLSGAPILSVYRRPTAAASPVAMGPARAAPTPPAALGPAAEPTPSAADLQPAAGR